MSWVIYNETTLQTYQTAYTKPTAKELMRGWEKYLRRHPRRKNESVAIMKADKFKTWKILNS